MQVLVIFFLHSVIKNRLAMYILKASILLSAYGSRIQLSHPSRRMIMRILSPRLKSNPAKIFFLLKKVFLACSILDFISFLGSHPSLMMVPRHFKEDTCSIVSPFILDFTFRRVFENKINNI